MLKKTFALSVAVLLLDLAGCGRSASSSACPSPGILDHLASLKVEDAARVADSRYESGQFKFLAVYGYSLDVVGVPESSATLERYGYTAISGTTDAPCSEEHAKRVAGARRYAEIYNRELLKRLSAGKGKAAR